ncbi:MAG: 50S ribosomal protein L4 [Leptonema sp. (in: bacteria)]
MSSKKVEKKLLVLDSQGNLKSEQPLEEQYLIEIDDKSYNLLHFALEAERWNRRQGTRKTKTRSEVSGGGKKPYKQKGTGYARQGSIRAPQFKGGATVFGPQPQNFYKKVNPKIKKLVYKILLNIKAINNQLYLIDNFPLSDYSTKAVYQTLKNANLLPFNTISLLFEDSEPYLLKSAMNIPNIDTISSLRPTLPEMYYNSILIFTSKGYENFKKVLEV